MIDEVTLEMLLLQLIPFLLTVFGLKVLIWKPMLAHLADRERNVSGFLHESELMSEEVASKSRQLDARIADARGEAAAERARLRAEAKQAEAELLRTARRDAERLVVDARTQLEGEKRAALAQVEATARALSSSIASRVLGREVGAGGAA